MSGEAERFLGLTQGEPSSPEASPARFSSAGMVPLRWRLGLLLLAWAVALTATFFPPEVVPPLAFLPFFPLGLLFVLEWPLKALNLPSGWLEEAWIFIGWALYLALSVFVGMSRRRRRFLTLFVVLAVLLAVNVVGCRVIMEGVSNIH